MLFGQTRLVWFWEVDVEIVHISGGEPMRCLPRNAVILDGKAIQNLCSGVHFLGTIRALCIVGNPKL